MTVLAVEDEARLFEPSEVTLEDQILGAWEALTARSRAECPVCHGELERSGCATCGSRSPDVPTDDQITGRSGSAEPRHRTTL